MKTPAVKGLFAAVAAVVLAVTPLVGRSVTIESIQAQQRYPWNGLVDIDYTITLAQGETLGVDDNLEVMLVDHDIEPAETNRALVFLQGALPMTAGRHRITWDAHADNITSRIDKAEFVMKIRHYSESYMVIDVSGGSSTNCYPVDFLNGAPAGGFVGSEYKGNKIVLRRIRPGSYMAGSPDNEANRTASSEKQHYVAISKPFYIGIYEVTQKQYENVVGNDNSTYKGDYRPVDNASYSTIRGTANTSTHLYDWPWNADVAPTSFMGLLRAKCKSKGDDGNYTESVEGFDLPTQFQWEYACRAGTTGAFNTTNAYNNADSSAQAAQLKLLGRYTNNQTDGKGGYDANHTTVGSYLPNQWGLYDMHGNISEWCLDWSTLVPNQYVDPKGADSGQYRVYRGGAWNNGVNYCRSGSRNAYVSSSPQGFRLARNLP